jgi:hypothetical protein
VTDGSEVLRDNAHDVATNQLIKRIAERNHTALEVVPTPIYFYSKIHAGRRCSCFDVNISQHSQCRCCFGTGRVGGYMKHGTNLEIIDVTHPNIRTVNVIPDYQTLIWPRRFKLVEGAKEGYFETRMYPETNIGRIDHIFNLSNEPAGTALHAYLKAAVDTEWQSFTRTSLQQRLYNTWIDFRIVFKRSTISSPSPTFRMFYLRYDRLEDKTLTANVPRTTKSNLLGEMGVADDWDLQRFWMDNTARSVTTEDFVAHINANTRWKINTVNESAPQNMLLSWEVDTRLILSYEAMQFVPL